MEKHTYIKINKYILNEHLYIKNNENNENKRNINNNFYIISLNNNNKKEKNKINLKNILNSFLIKITIYKLVLTYYIKLCQIYSMFFY